MKINIKKVTDAARQATAMAVVPVFSKGTLSVAAANLDKASGKSISRLIATEEFEGKPGQTLLLRTPDGVSARRILLAGVGEPKKLSMPTLVKILRATMAAIKTTAAKDALFYVDGLDAGELDMASCLVQLGIIAGKSDYRYSKTLSKPGAPTKLKRFSVATAAKPTTAQRKALNEGAAIAHGCNVTRELGNLPANICTPGYLASHARALARKNDNFSCRVLDERKMSELGMNSLLSVTSGTAEPAKLIILEYRGAERGKAPHVLVGKGITFDSGGISLKPGGSMDEMKYDMCGAASVLGTMTALAELKPKINVVAIVPAAENLPDGKATKPGDVVTSMAGITIEILNTDAEGRLVLCDALTYAARYKPASVIDIATLTGACVVALGKPAFGLYANDDKLAEQLLDAGTATHDRGWRLPLWEDYAEQLKSNFADLANVGGREAGSITAAMFLSRFASDYRWAHLDIAGPAWISGAAKGATGRSVAMLTRYLLDRA